MRCFIAIDLPSEIKEELKKIQLQIANRSGSNLKASYPKDFHITLRFLGEINNTEYVKEQLKKVKFSEIKASLGETGYFQNRKFVRVLWIGIEPKKEIINLKKNIDTALEKEFTREKDFKAHVTLARVKHCEDKERLMTVLKQVDFDKEQFEISDFKLKKSTLTEETAVYEDIAEFKSQL